MMDIIALGKLLSAPVEYFYAMYFSHFIHFLIGTGFLWESVRHGQQMDKNKSSNDIGSIS